MMRVACVVASLLVVSLVVVVVVAAGGCAGKKKEVQAGAKEAVFRPDRARAAALVRAGDEYEQMRTVLTFASAAEREEFDRAVSRRNAGYEAWLRTEAGQRYEAARRELESARRSRATTRVAELEAEYRALRAEQEAERTRLRREFNKVLTPAQRRQWAGHMLYQAALASPALRGRTMTEAQRVKAHEICETMAAEAMRAETIEKDPYLRPGAGLVTRAAEAIGGTVFGGE